MAYTTTIVEVGTEALAFLDENMAVTFAGNAPEELRSFCFLLDKAGLDCDLALGQGVRIGDQLWAITALGEVAQKNFANLGHATFVFDGGAVARMPGAIHLGGVSERPALALGAEVVFSCE